MRAQGISGEAFLPQPWGDLYDIGGWTLAYSLKHIDQLVIGINPMQPAGDDQALDDAHKVTMQIECLLRGVVLI